MSVCPYLRKQLVGGATCFITKSKVIPEYFERYCTGSYVDCQYYRTPEREQIKNVTPEISGPIHVKIIDKQLTTRNVEIPQQSQIFNPSEVHNLLNELDNVWHQYETRATEIIKRWETEREKIISEILKEYSKLDSILVNEEELEGRKLIGLIKDDEYKVLKEKIAEERKVIESKIKNFIEQIISFEKKISPHRERLHLELKQQDFQVLNKRLTDLENAKEKGIISSIAYEKLKREINAQINILTEIYKSLGLTPSPALKSEGSS